MVCGANQVSRAPQIKCPFTLMLAALALVVDTV